MGYSTLKTRLDEVVKTNGRQQITGANLNGVMTTLLQGVDIADRANGTDTTGKSYKILDKDKTFAEQVTGANTIYEIRDSFSLGGSSVSIPAGCILFFNGGKLTNGTLVGANTTIASDPVQIFGQDITISGTWDVEDARVEWFGAVGDGSTDDYSAINKTLVFKDISLLAKAYRISNVIQMSGNQTIKGVYGKTTISVDSGNNGIRVGHSCSVKNLSIKVGGAAYAIVVDSELINSTYDSADLSYIHTANINISNILINTTSETANGYGILVSSNGTGTSFWQVRFSNIKIIGYFEEAIRISAENSGWVTDVTFEDVKISGCATGVRCVNTTSSAANLGRISFYNVSMQYNASRSLYFAKVEKCQRISFVNCEPFDWVGVPFSVSPVSEGVSLVDCTNGNGKSVELSSDLSTANADSFPYKVIKNGRDASLPVYDGASYFTAERLAAGTITKQEFFNLPSGLYYFSSAYASDVGSFLNIPGLPGVTYAYGTMLIIRRFNQGLFAQFFVNGYGQYYAAIFSRFMEGVSSGSDALSDAWDYLQPGFYNYDSEANFLAGKGYAFLGLINGKFARRASSSKATDASGRKFIANYASSVPSISGFAYSDTGQHFFYTTQRRPLFAVQSAGIWVDALGRPYDRKASGTTSERPTDAQLVVGDTYFDITLGKPIWYKGNSEWVDATGAVV